MFLVFYIYIYYYYFLFFIFYYFYYFDYLIMVYYYDYRFFKCLYNYEYMCLVSYNCSINARKNLLNIWNYYFQNEKLNENSILNDELLTKIIDYNNQFCYENKKPIHDKLINDRKHYIYHEDQNNNYLINNINEQLINKNKDKETKIIDLSNNSKIDIMINKDLNSINQECENVLNYIFEKSYKQIEINNITKENNFLIDDYINTKNENTLDKIYENIILKNKGLKKY